MDKEFTHVPDEELGKFDIDIDSIIKREELKYQHVDKQKRLNQITLIAMLMFIGFFISVLFDIICLWLKLPTNNISIIDSYFKLLPVLALLLGINVSKKIK